MFRVLSLICALYSLGGIAKPKTAPPAPVQPSKAEEGGFVIEKRGDGTTVKYKKSTKYDFEGANIDGLYNKPSGAYISNIKDVKGKSVIRIRENFDGEVADSARLLR
ncbi:MAG: hypothetical protein HYR96_09370 [Deltaproteobacteria bacterium]|nr:hypothetical protein [Deltaproteobacteria bacterium]MBI3296165.1 hypothetical protein [Deltaproteobacteria bacterium]